MESIIPHNNDDNVPPSFSKKSMVSLHLKGMESWLETDEMLHTTEMTKYVYFLFRISTTVLCRLSRLPKQNSSSFEQKILPYTFLFAEVVQVGCQLKGCSVQCFLSMELENTRIFPKMISPACHSHQLLCCMWSLMFIETFSGGDC